MNKSILLILILILWGCSSSDIEKHQNKRRNMADVKERFLQFNEEDVYLRSAPISVGGDYIILYAYGGNDKFIHLFSRDNLEYVGSFGEQGQGPGEIITIGDVMVSEDNEHVYAFDYGHYVVYQYHIDSALHIPNYKPQIKQRLQQTVFPSWITFFSDTLSYGKLVLPTNNSFREVAGKWNLLTGETKMLDYQHPDVRVKRIMVGASLDKGIYVEANNRYDLLSIFDLEGNLKHNIYGPNWDSRGDYKSHFGRVVIYKNYIIAAYDGTLYEKHLHSKVCHVFDIEGNYIKTLDTGKNIIRMAVDEENDRLLFCFDNEMQFAYLDLKDIL